MEKIRRRAIRFALLPFMVCTIAVVACGRPDPVGQFGAYHRTNSQLRLPDGQRLVVYRVKYWSFSEGGSALQLKSEPPFDVSDTARVRKMVHRLWPAFGVYVESLHLRSAIVTATNLRHRGMPFVGTTTFESFGFIATRDSMGHWMIENGSDPLPAILGDGKPRIYEPDGSVFRLRPPDE